MGAFIAVIFLASAVIVGVLMHKAGPGWEDKAGFHAGSIDDQNGREQ